ncbi:MAG: phosphotransferase family protein [Gammaproteobacteria bacterium]|jgi:aminoglycoside phosphotransferase (APT) family kinase protein|nr:phosphotransferase family protein [Gammaproteobacteria bacterium]MBT4494114.1 phosphotransferase family protein [Gammaproteobacteria bacterium]MBT7371009.1 phosphotransferase family protein [Gammaproteobacteria bacterium]
MNEEVEPIEQRLEKAIKNGAPELNVQKITKVERLTGGLSSQNYFVTADTDGGEETWVMRVEPKEGIITPYSMEREFNLLRAVAKEGIPVPDVLYLEQDKSVMDGAFILMSLVKGEIYSQDDPRLHADPALKKSIQHQFVEALAKLHGISQDVLTNYATGTEAVRAEVAVYRTRLARAEQIPNPALRHALDVLEQGAPKAQRISLLHGDYRLPNLMFNEGKLVAILDWELARIGDPLGDIAFTQTTGAGVCSIEGELAEYYTELTGIKIDEAEMEYQRFLEGTKGGIIGLGGATAVSKGGTDLRLLSVATFAQGGGRQPAAAGIGNAFENILEKQP